MSKLTVQAMDSAAAMDEIVSKLGPDAVILSTTKVNGKVVMEAASGAPPSKILPNDGKKFTNIFILSSVLHTYLSIFTAVSGDQLEWFRNGSNRFITMGNRRFLSLDHV